MTSRYIAPFPFYISLHYTTGAVVCLNRYSLFSVSGGHVTIPKLAIMDGVLF